MKEAVKYKCNGGEITIAEAARALFVSVGSVRIRLKKYGGNMQKVWDFYAGKEAKAVDEIMSALGVEEDETAAEPEAQETSGTPWELEEVGAPEPETAVQTTEETESAEPEDEKPEAEPDQDADENPLAALRRLNRAIDALNSLYGGDVGVLARSVTGLLYELRAYRAQEFDSLVDWDLVAKGVKK